MSAAKHTRWFPQTQRPTLPGVYQRKLPYFYDGFRYAMWDGERWFPCYKTANSAAREYKFQCPSGFQCEDKGIHWRGLAKATGAAQ